jgi:hypothetical protein
MLGSTDELGRFAFTAPVNNPNAGDPVVLTIRANLYNDSHSEIRLCPGNNAAVAVTLDRAKKLGNVTGQVTDAATGQGMEDAVVEVLLEGFPQPMLHATTDDQGNYIIRGVSFAQDLALRAKPAAPSCAPPLDQPLHVNGDVTENVQLARSIAAEIRCTPEEEGDLSAGDPDAGAAPAISASSNLAAVSTTGTPNAVAEDVTNPAALATDPNIQWHETTSEAILYDASVPIWNSGHVNDILKIATNEALVGTDTGGVWHLAWTSVSAAAVPLSNTWNSVNISSLAQGPDGAQHVYAGTVNKRDGNPGGTLWETDTSSVAPLANWIPHDLHGFCPSILHILVINEFRRIVIACDTGVFWSQIPAAPAAQGTYLWAPAVAGKGVAINDIDSAFARLAKGPGWIGPSGRSEGTIALSRWFGSAPDRLFYVGAWEFFGKNNIELVLNAASVATGGGTLNVGRTNLASCSAAPNIMYATAANPDDNNSRLIAVWMSKDGGRSWGLVHLPPDGAPPNGTGGNGWYTQALGVSPFQCSTFAIGWTYSAFASFDGGQTYPMALNGASSGCSNTGCHLHDDYHALLFDPTDPTTLWFGSDGGIASATGVFNGGTPKFASYYNEHLADLQFYHASPSYRSEHLVAGPLQDNSTVYSVVPGPWRRVPGASGDGADSSFANVGPAVDPGLPPGSSDLLAWVTHQATYVASIWDGTKFGSAVNLPVSGNPTGINEGPSWNVRIPTFSNGAGELMYVVAGTGSKVFGLFGMGEGTDMHWEQLGSIGSGENANSISSRDGNVVFVGTDRGNICMLQKPYTGPCVDFSIAPSTSGARITGVLEFSNLVGFATTSSGLVLSLAGTEWQASTGLPNNSPFASVDGPNLGSVFVANTDQVFVTHDFGFSWLSASQGLPAVPNPNELHYVKEPDGSSELYLGSYGRSMYRTVLP